MRKLRGKRRGMIKIVVVVVVVVVVLMMLEDIPTSPVSFYGCFAAILTINPHLKYFDAVICIL